MSKHTANILLLLAGLAWGLGFVAQETAMEDVGPFQFVGLRFILAAIVVTPFAIWEIKKLGKPNLSNKQKQMFGIVGVAFFVPMSLQQFGLLGTSVTNAGMLTGLYVLFVPAIAFGLLKQSQPKFIVVCAVAAVAGIWMLGGTRFEQFTWGDGLVLLCSIMWAVHVLVLGYAVKDIGLPVTITAVQFAIAGVLGLIGFQISVMLGLPFEPTFSMHTLNEAATEIIYAAVFAGGLAFTLQAIGQKYTDASVAAMLLSSETLFAALGGAIIIGERLSITGYMGCALLFIAIATTSTISAKQNN